MFEFVINKEYPKGCKLEVPDEPMPQQEPTAEESMQAQIDENTLAIADLMYGGI